MAQHVLGFDFLTLEPGTTISLLYMCIINRENGIISQACLNSTIFQMNYKDIVPLKLTENFHFNLNLSELGFHQRCPEIFPQTLGTTSQLLPYLNIWMINILNTSLSISSLTNTLITE